METKEYLQMLRDDIHLAAFAAIGGDGHPQVRIIDSKLCNKPKPLPALRPLRRGVPFGAVEG